MKALKFRVWDGRTMFGEDTHQFALSFDGSVVRCTDSGFEFAGCKQVMQYTGLKDKNGKEIYKWEHGVQWQRPTR